MSMRQMPYGSRNQAALARTPLGRSAQRCAALPDRPLGTKRPNDSEGVRPPMAAQLEPDSSLAMPNRWASGSVNAWATMERRTAMAEETLIEKIRSLRPERVAEVEDFVDFLTVRDQERQFTHAATRLSEEAFRAVWDNADDAEYDRL